MTSNQTLTELVFTEEICESGLRKWSFTVGFGPLGFNGLFVEDCCTFFLHSTGFKSVNKTIVEMVCNCLGYQAQYHECAEDEDSEQAYFIVSENEITLKHFREFARCLNATLQYASVALNK